MFRSGNEVYSVDASRLEYQHGDINGSYSGDRISEDKPVRHPFTFKGVLWTCTGTGGGRDKKRKAWAYRLVTRDAFDGTPVTYHEVIGPKKRNNPKGFYHGMLVKHKKELWVLLGPEHTFEAGFTVEQSNLF